MKTLISIVKSLCLLAAIFALAKIVFRNCAPGGRLGVRKLACALLCGLKFTVPILRLNPRMGNV